jgi:hypothetical protein
MNPLPSTEARAGTQAAGTRASLANRALLLGGLLMLSSCNKESPTPLTPTPTPSPTHTPTPIAQTPPQAEVPKSNIAVMGFKVSPETTVTSAPITLSLTVKNTGRGNSSGGLSITIREKNVPLPDQSDTMDLELTSYYWRGVLASGATSTISFKCKGPDSAYVWTLYPLLGGDPEKDNFVKNNATCTLNVTRESVRSGDDTLRARRNGEAAGIAAM